MFYEHYDTDAQQMRSLKYEAAMTRLHTAYPKDNEASVFYALSLLEAVDLTDKTYARQLKAAALRYAALSEKLDGMAVRADRIFKKIEAGDGTVGAMIQDKQVYDDMRSLLADLKKHPWKMLWKE